MSRFNAVKQSWVPGDCGVQGNEIWNALAWRCGTSIWSVNGIGYVASKNWEQVFEKDKCRNLNEPKVL